MGRQADIIKLTCAVCNLLLRKRRKYEEVSLLVLLGKWNSEGLEGNDTWHNCGRREIVAEFWWKPSWKILTRKTKKIRSGWKWITVVSRGFDVRRFGFCQNIINNFYKLDSLKRNILRWPPLLYEVSCWMFWSSGVVFVVQGKGDKEMRDFKLTPWRK